MKRQVMIRVVVLMLMSLSLIARAHSGEDADAEREKQAIVQTVDLYIDGGRKGSGEAMKKAFHEGATVYAAGGGGPIELLFDRVDEMPPQPDIPYALTDLVVFRDIAMARLEIGNWGGFRYTDMLTFVKTAEGWKIVGKVSHRHPPGKND